MIHMYVEYSLSSLSRQLQVTHLCALYPNRANCACATDTRVQLEKHFPLATLCHLIVHHLDTTPTHAFEHNADGMGEIENEVYYPHYTLKSYGFRAHGLRLQCNRYCTTSRVLFVPFPMRRCRVCEYIEIIETHWHHWLNIALLHKRPK